MIEELSQDAIEQIGAADGEGLDFWDIFTAEWWKNQRTAIDAETLP